MGCATRLTAPAFREALVAAVPCRIRIVLTGNGIRFRLPPRDADGPITRQPTHMVDLRCAEHGIEHRFTRIDHSLANGQHERMNGTVQDAMARGFHHDNHGQFREHLGYFVAAYDGGRRLERLRRLTPWQFIPKAWAIAPQGFTTDPPDHLPGRNVQPDRMYPGGITWVRSDKDASSIGAVQAASPPRAMTANGLRTEASGCMSAAGSASGFWNPAT